MSSSTSVPRAAWATERCSVAMQVGAGPLETAVRLDAQMHVQIAGRSAAERGGPGAGDAQRRAVVDARGDLDGEGPVLQPPALAAAVGAG